MGTFTSEYMGTMARLAASATPLPPVVTGLQADTTRCRILQVQAAAPPLPLLASVTQGAQPLCYVLHGKGVFTLTLELASACIELHVLVILSACKALATAVGRLTNGCDPGSRSRS